MQFHTIKQIGTFHTNYCEDYTMTAALDGSKWLCAVMDGCTMGTDSYFAATLIGKLLRKIAKTIYYLSFVNKNPTSLEGLLKNILEQLWEELRSLQNQLQLEEEELLSTLILLVLDENTKTARGLVVGDGIICLNGEITEFDHDNKPDYLGYHLQKPFEEWYVQQSQTFAGENLSDISISTDGIFTFQAFDNGDYEVLHTDLMDYLLVDTNGIDQPTMFKKKLYHIEKTWGLKPSDDLGIVRVVWD